MTICHECESFDMGNPIGNCSNQGLPRAHFVEVIKGLKHCNGFKARNKEERSMVTICVKCGFYDETGVDEQTDTCLSPEAPYQYFISDKKYCQDINAEGKCKFYSPKDEPESIYELKKDEDLANTGKPLDDNMTPPREDK
jgi:hypothetical protein